jgi:hypothetical protein
MVETVYPLGHGIGDSEDFSLNTNRIRTFLRSLLWCYGIREPLPNLIA